MKSSVRTKQDQHRSMMRTVRLCVTALVVALASAFAILAAPTVKELVVLAIVGILAAAAIFASAVMFRPVSRREVSG